MSWLETWAMIQVIGMAFAAIPFVIITLYVVFVIFKDTIRQWKCRHAYYSENMACHAICNHCRKDLGFIGTVREQRAKK